MRARMAIYLNGISCELREVKLSNKPRDMLLISPKGTVPVLQLNDGHVIEESLDIVFWSFKIKNESNVYIKYKQNQENIDNMISTIDNKFKYNLDRYKYPDRYNDVDPVFHKKKCFEIITDLNSMLLDKKYFFSEEIGIADICIFPFIRQFRIADTKWFDEKMKLDNIMKWFVKINNSDIFNEVMFKYEPWLDNNKSFIFPNL